MKRVAGIDAIPLVLGVCALGLVAGFALKAQCMADWSHFIQYERLCYNDIQPLYGARGIDADTFPYVSGSLQDGDLLGGAIEYPVLTGVFMWATGLLVDNVDQYLIVSTVLLVPFALLVAHLLSELRGPRALMWAAAPALVFYAFHNWDLLVVAAATAGFFAWSRDRPVWSAVLFGLGGALKGYPLLFLPALALHRWFVGRRDEAAIVLGAGAGVFAVVNLPFVLASPSGWWATYEFHSRRGPNFDTIWAIREFGPLSLPKLEPDALNLVTFALTGTFIVVALIVGLIRARREGGYPFLPVAAACLASFMLWNKVHSPQYTLWILPLFALVAVNWVWWAAYSIVDAAVYVGVFRFFFDACSRDASCNVVPPEPTLAQHVMELGVFGRAGLLLALFVVFLRASPGSLHRTPTSQVDYDRLRKSRTKDVK